VYLHFVQPDPRFVLRCTSYWIASIFKRTFANSYLEGEQILSSY
jgi:hypothetical protein